MAEGDMKTRPARIDVEALELAKVAAAFKGVSVVQYASQVLRDAANRDIEAWYDARSQSKPAKPRRPKDP